MKLPADASSPGIGTLVPAVGLLLLAAMALVLATPALARPKPDLKGLDLEVRPGDVKLKPRKPLLQALPEPKGPEAALPIDPNTMAQTDQVERTEIPRQRRDGETGSGEGSVLEQILEDHTIPLFRLRMDSPF